MLTIPVEIQSLLKSKVMIGENRPTGYIEVEGMPPAQSLTDPTAWTTWRTFVGSGKGYGNMCETADGRGVIIYVESNAVKIAYAPTVAGVLGGTETFATGSAITLAANREYARTSINLVDGKLNVVIVWLPQDSSYRRAEHWRDTDGNGTGFTKISDITTDLGSGSYTDFRSAGNLILPSLIQKLANGNLICILPFNTYVHQTMKAFYSTDDGATWTGGAAPTFGLGNHLGYCHSQSFYLVSGSSYVTLWLSSSGWGCICEWTSSGAAMTKTEWGSGWGTWPHNEPWFAGMVLVGKKCYICAHAHVSNKVDIFLYTDTDYSAASFADAANWQYLHTISNVDQSNIPNFFLLTKSALICQHSQYSNGSYISGAGTAVEKQSIGPKSLVIDRSKGSASQATVVLDNKNGIYAPDSSGAWSRVLWLNKAVKIYMGYGTKQQLVFSGLIDEIEMTTFPAELRITARDYSKWALDQMVQGKVGGVTVYAMLYENQTPEAIFTDLAVKAGWDTENIHANVTGLTFKKLQFGHESIGDAFQRLAEISSWEWFCDEAGDLFFRAVTEPTPQATYVFTEGVDIFSLGYRISDADLHRDVVVWSADEGGSTVKATVTWGAADYNNVLPLKTLIINAGDLATTTAQCATLAHAAADAITPKVREVNFVVVGNPYLQIGDCIQVIETTTTISELYRILEISHQMVAEGNPVFATALRCYHYASA